MSPIFIHLRNLTFNCEESMKHNRIKRKVFMVGDTGLEPVTSTL